MANNSIWFAAAIVCTTVACGEDERVVTSPPDASIEHSAGTSGTSGSGGTGGAGDGAGGASTTTRTTTTRGSAIALTNDGKRAVALNRVGGFASIVDVVWPTTGNPLTKKPQVNFDAGSEPWAVVIDEATDAAYVILRAARELVRISNISGTPAKDVSVATGSEPTGIAISPNGTYLYVANWGEGTIDIYLTASPTFKSTIDLNPALVATGSLGSIAPRPGLAHPRSVVVTNDGDTDDDDEKLYVTEFFSQQRPGFTPLQPSDFDVARQGYVYVVKASTTPTPTTIPIPIAPVGTEFRDSNGCPTSCFPNQLFSATLDGTRLYVTAVCTSPVGPIGQLAPVAAGANCIPESDASNPANFRTLFHSSIFVVDTQTDTELPLERALLPQEFDHFYKQKGDVDDAGVPLPDNGGLPKLAPIPLTPVDLAFAPGTHDAYVAAYGSDAVFRVSYASDGTHSVGSDVKHFINLYPPGLAPGRLPTGIAIASDDAFAVVVNENTRNVSLVDLDAVNKTSPQVVYSTSLGNTDNGRWAFATGREHWSFAGRTWGACDSCHVDGWSDGVTWFFSRGPRQTPPLDSSYLTRSPDPLQRRIMNWTAVFDEVHDLDVIARGVLGAVGAIVWDSGITNGDRITYDGTSTGIRRTLTKHNGLNGSSAALMPNVPAVACQPDAGPCNSIMSDWDDIDLFVQSLRSPAPPTTGLDAAEVTAGRQLFESAGCASCHAGPGWTISQLFYTPNELNNNGIDGGPALLRATLYTTPTGFRRELNPPLLDYDGSAPLRYAGDAGTANDQINCVLRDVGTWTSGTGVAPDGGAPVLERRQDMTAVSQGQTGFNPPSLLGVAASGPYFHAGNARTLEELFDAAFAKHHQAIDATFLSDPTTRATQIHRLVVFLLSIDRSTPTFAVPSAADLCAAIPPDSGIK